MSIIEPMGERHPILRALEAALTTAHADVTARLAKIRVAHPEADPAQLCAILDRLYLGTVCASGAVAGGVAAAPGVGIPAGLALATADGAAFLTASAGLALAYAAIYDLRADDVEQRRMLVMTILLGESGQRTVARIAGRTGAHWGKKAVGGIPISTIRQVNTVLGRNFVTKYGTKQGILVLGKSIPFGIGALVGAGGNLAFGIATVKATHRAFGEPPNGWSPPAAARWQPTPDEPLADSPEGMELAAA